MKSMQNVFSKELFISAYDSGNLFLDYRETCNISRTLLRNKIVDLSDVVGAAPI